MKIVSLQLTKILAEKKSELKVPAVNNDIRFTNVEKDSLELLKSKAKNCPRFEYYIFDGAEHDFEGFEQNIINSVLKFLNIKI